MRLSTCPLPWMVAGACCSSLFRRPGLVERQDIPSNSTFVRRSYCSAAVVGDYVYIDGGEVSQEPLLNVTGNDWAVNSTISITLKKSWTTSNVTMNSITKDSPKLDSPSIWLGPSGNEFYNWAGEKIYNFTTPENEIWRFTADGSGGGKWTMSPPSNPYTFQTILRPTSGTFTQSKDIGYYFGGVVKKQSDSIIDNYTVVIPNPGLVSYNMTSGEIKNSTGESNGQNMTFKEGSVQFLPFGGAGILLFLGGQAAPVASRRDEDFKEVGFEQVTLFDIKSQRWYSQKTTGNIPTKRRRFCAAGVLSSNNTFEIFLYGGCNSVGRVFNDVHVLSIPGFNFFKATTDSTPRFNQACVVVGRRQMLSVGGLGKITPRDGWSEPDPWPYGLGVFDMTEMVWKDGYSSDDAAYESPEVVRQWYNEGHNITWSSEEVRSLFSESSQDELPSIGPSTTPDRNGTSNDADESRSSSPPAGTIAGAVIGGVFGLALLIGLAFFFIKRRKTHTATAQHPPHATQATDSMHQKHGSQSTAHGEQNTLEQHQLHGVSRALEMDGSSGLVEAHGRSIPVELPAEIEPHEAKSRRVDLR